MIKIFIILILILFFYLKYTYKFKIKYKTFLKRGFQPDRGVFGIYCYCGKQGTGKTYSVVEFLMNNKDMRIYSNIHSIKNLSYTKITGFKELLQLRSEHDCIIVYDEIFTELTRHSKLNTDVLDFLCQMRKRKIIFLTTAQDWTEIPITFRKFCRYQINTHLICLPIFGGILIKNFKDAENMKWSNEEQEHIAPLISNTITHTQKWIANSYDTFEQISNSSSKVSTPLKEEKESSIDENFWEDVSIIGDVEDGGVTTTPPMSELCQDVKWRKNEE